MHHLLLRCPRFLPFALSALCACPSQELAPLSPCTVAAASIDASQTGVNKVDLLFVIDDSGSMSEEQIKLGQQLPRLVSVLTSGDLDGVPNADAQPDFTPVASLHLGVVSSDLGVNGQTGILSCGDRSFSATEPDIGAPGIQLFDKPHGDEGRLSASNAVALAGVNVQVDGDPVQKIAPRPECADVSVQRFLEFEAGTSDPAEVARQFGCIAELGVNGCGYEQPLESMWRALAPSTKADFSGGGLGQGAPSGFNAGFLRNDAILAIVLVSDEEDCSSPDASRSLLYVSPNDDKNANLLCARNPDALHPVSRYVEGLKSLKPEAYQDRIIFAGIVGVPTADQTSGLSFDQLLALPSMQPKEETGIQGATPRLAAACVAPDGAGRADPARRAVEVAKGFGEGGVITSICESDYGAALSAVIAKIATKLSGACLPRQLKVNAEGLVECQVVEIKADGDTSPCLPEQGRTRQLETRVIGGSPRVVCEVAQLPVLSAKVPSGVGWYYDNFSKEVMQDCKVNKQRVAFAKDAPLADGALARVECQQSVLNAEPSARGQEAVNAPCIDDGMGGAKGDAKCQALSVQPSELLICVQGTCQLRCATNADCPPSFVCSADALGRGFCANPTCPIAEQADPAQSGATVPTGS